VILCQFFGLPFAGFEPGLDEKVVSHIAQLTWGFCTEKLTLNTQKMPRLKQGILRGPVEEHYDRGITLKCSESFKCPSADTVFYDG
jgi:hypothetical protein